jgi:tetratricopeptide (TPR) repeat protein
MMFYTQAEYTISLGRVREARKIFDEARTNALQSNPKEMAGAITQDEAQFFADLGFSGEARTMSGLAMSMMPDSADRKAYAALILARVGDLRRAEVLANEASKARPLDLLMNNVTLACARAAARMNKKDPAGAIAELQRAQPYDFSDTSKGETNYYRGEAYLQLRSGKQAAGEFQKILENRGPSDFLHWSLAHLGLARAYTLTGDKDKSLAAYREFFGLWKNADPDVPILKQAQAEYAKLQ